MSAVIRHLYICCTLLIFSNQLKHIVTFLNFSGGISINKNDTAHSGNFQIKSYTEGSDTT